MILNLSDDELMAVRHAIKTTWGVGVKQQGIAALLLNVEARLNQKEAQPKDETPAEVKCQEMEN